MANGGGQLDNTAKKVDNSAKDISEAVFAELNQGPLTKADKPLTRSPDGLGERLATLPQMDEVNDNATVSDKGVVKDQVGISLDFTAINLRLADSVDQRMTTLARSNQGEANGLELLKNKNSAGDALVQNWKQQFSHIDAIVWAKLEK